MSILVGFLAVGTGLLALNSCLGVFLDMTGMTSAELTKNIISALPNLVNFISSIIDLFKMFFNLLPDNIGVIFELFLSIMSIIVLFKLVRNGGE